MLSMRLCGKIVIELFHSSLFNLRGLVMKISYKKLWTIIAEKKLVNRTLEKNYRLQLEQ